MAKQYTGIEEVTEVARNLECSDYQTAFLFLKVSTGQLFAQMFLEKEEKPSDYKDEDIMFLGKLSSDTSYEDIMNMIKVAFAKRYAEEKEMETYLKWYAENERR